MITSVIKVELETAGVYDRDAEFVITADRKPSDREAVTIARVLYPNHFVGAIEVTDVEETIKMKNEALHVYSAGCSWHGPIKKAGQNGVPCCPWCGSVLFQTEEVKWQSGAREHEGKGHTNYVEFLSWAERQRRCWPSLRVAALDFKRETGKEVKWDL